MKLPHHDSRAAELFDDLASGLDAGLPIDHLLGAGTLRRLAGPIDTSGGVVPAAEARGVPFSIAEHHTLASAERSGQLPAALRRAAQRRRERARRTREILGRFAYPAVLVLVALVVFGLTPIGRGPIYWFLGGLALVAGTTWWFARRVRTDPAADAVGWPGLGAMLQNSAEVPYLEALLGAYRAGIAIPEAHSMALAAVPVASVKRRLFNVGQALERSGQPLAETLAAHGALHEESLDILALAEPAGDLENGLERALRRREETLDRQLDRAARVVSTMVYAAVVGMVVWLIFSFYSQYLRRF